MESWKPRKLNELGSVARGRSRHRPRNDPSLYGGPYPFFQTGDIKAANFYLSEFLQTYNEEGLAQSKLWKPGTLCITIAANIAETAVLKIEGCFPDSVVGFIPDTEKVDVRFIKYSVDLMKLRMQNISRGTTQDNLSVEKLLSFDFRVPCIDKQREIADFIAAYDLLIENNTRRIMILEETAQSLYREWFIHFRFPGHDNAKLVESKAGPIPDGWRIATLREICERVDYGYTASAKEDAIGPKFLRITDIVPDLIDWSSVPYCKITDANLDKYRIRAGDIVIARTGATTGYAKLIHTNEEVVFASYLVRVRPNPEIDKYWVGILVQSAEYKSFIRSNLGGSAQPQANAQVLTSIPVVVPPTPTLNKFGSLVKPLFDQKEILHKENANLRLTRDLLMPRLLTGNLTV
jgi:type I restriction enzyme S subunit